AQAILERRKLILGAIHPNLAGFASRENADADSTHLFGDDHRVKIREAIELNKELNQFARSVPSAKRGRFFNTYGGTSTSQQPRFHSFQQRRFSFPPRGGHQHYRPQSSRGHTRRPGIHSLPAVVPNPIPEIRRLKSYLGFWHSFTTDPWILDCVQGYKLPFKQIPSPNLFPPPIPIPADKISQVNLEVLKLLRKGAIEESLHPYFVSPIFVVPKKSGGLRPIINLKKLNKYIVINHFKLEKIQLVKDLLSQNMWMAKIDLEDAYFSISIHETHQVGSQDHSVYTGKVGTYMVDRQHRQSPTFTFPSRPCSGNYRIGFFQHRLGSPVWLTNHRSSITVSTRPAPEHPKRLPSLSESEPSTTSGMANFRGPCDAPPLSNRTTELMSASIRKGTQKSYRSAWKSFCDWCELQKHDPLSASVPIVLNYLAYLEEIKKLSYRTINVHRSALSFHISGGNTQKIGHHPDVLKLMKGIFNSNPPFPRYSHTWDVDTVVSYISSLPPNDDLSLRTLSFKFVALCALSNADRSSDIKALDLSTLIYRPEGALFRFSSLRKTSRPGRLHDSFYPSFPANPNICVVHTLKAYIHRTQPLRSSSLLIISYTKPHKPVSSSTIARWILNVLNSSGIDTSIFKAHSTRGSATTSAKLKGVSLSEIQACADWTSSSTFTKFYYRPKFSSVFAHAVLNSKGIALNVAMVII
ncbi:unnamed protein product, partial [Allacma fusca]